MTSEKERNQGNIREMGNTVCNNVNDSETEWCVLVRVCQDRERERERERVSDERH